MKFFSLNFSFSFVFLHFLYFVFYIADSKPNGNTPSDFNAVIHNSAYAPYLKNRCIQADFLHLGGLCVVPPVENILLFVCVVILKIIYPVIRAAIINVQQFSWRLKIQQLYLCTAHGYA